MLDPYKIQVQVIACVVPAMHSPIHHETLCSIHHTTYTSMLGDGGPSSVPLTVVRIHGKNQSFMWWVLSEAGRRITAVLTALAVAPAPATTAVVVLLALVLIL